LELNEKVEEIKVLKERYELLEGKHMREELIVSKDQAGKMQKQVSVWCYYSVIFLFF